MSSTMQTMIHGTSDAHTSSREGCASFTKGRAGMVAAESSRVRARVSNGARALPGIIAALDQVGIAVSDVTVARPSLDDVYLCHAGRSFQHPDAAGTARADGRGHGPASDETAAA
jgi:hypothetical protein